MANEITPAATDINRTPPFSSKRFAPAVGQFFSWRAFGSNGSEVVVLLKLVELTMRRGSNHIEQFSMRFTGAADTALDQGTYTVSNDVTGSEALFAVPVGLDASGLRQYEVCVSRSLEAWERDAAAPFSNDD